MKIPLCLVAGFLGCGKTTLLRRLAERRSGRSFIFIVNEFNAVDVDGVRLEMPPGRMVSVAGGSIFCRCKAGEFIKVLKEVSRRRGCTGVIVEASGIADPSVLPALLEETRLERFFGPAAVIAIVDPGSFLKLVATLPAAVAQVRAARLVLLNKCDLYLPEELDQTEREVRRLNSGAEILRTEHCRAHFDLFALDSARKLKGRYARCADPRFCTVAARVPAQADLRLLQAELDAAAQDLFRVKGFVKNERCWEYWDWSNGIWNKEPAAARADSILVLIGRGAARERLEALQKEIEGA
jgi:G3E family GTPase